MNMNPENSCRQFPIHTDNVYFGQEFMGSRDGLIIHLRKITFHPHAN